MKQVSSLLDKLKRSFLGTEHRFTDKEDIDPSGGLLVPDRAYGEPAGRYEKRNGEQPPPIASPSEEHDPIKATTRDSWEPAESVRSACAAETDELWRLLAHLDTVGAATSFELVGGNGELAAAKQGRTLSENGGDGSRVPLKLQACAVGHSTQEGEWTEMTCTIELSRKGTTLCLRRRVDAGAILRLTLQLPHELRSGDYPAPNYSIYGVVRRTEPSDDGVKVELEFLGDKPPERYSGTSKTRWSGPERRLKAREQSWDVIWVEYLDERMRCVKKEMTRTEDVGAGGMRVIAKSPPSTFELVRVSYPNHAFETYAAVCNRYFGRDGGERLCLRFLDHDWYARSGEASGLGVTDGVRTDKDESGPRPKKILVADDDPPFRKVLGKVLSQAGYQVVLAEDGKMAVEKTKTEKPDLVITDVLMPKMHGFLVCKEIKQLEAPPKVILLTAVYTKPSYKWEAKDDYGADDMIPKPFVIADLLARIEHHLSRDSMQRG